MTDEAVKLLEKAERALRAAEILLRSHDAESAMGRTYYAMFHATQALLRTRNLRYRKHAGVPSAFGEQFVKTGTFDARFHRWLLAAFNERLQTEYGLDSRIDEQAVTTWLERAHEFLVETRRHLSTQADELRDRETP